MAEKNEIISTRIVNAPRETVWKLWSEPEHLAKWWGPKGFTNTFQKHEFKPNGLWQFVMHGPDGTNYPNEIQYLEIEKPSRIVFEHTNGPCFHVTATFEDLGKRTKINFHASFRNADEFNRVKDFAILGNEQNFDRIEAELSKITGVLLPKEFIIERTYSAPRETIWKLWTDPEHLTRWWGPKGVRNVKAKMDFRRGGTFLYCMITEDGMEMWGKKVYRDIVKPSRLLWVNSFSDAQGGVSRHPLAPQWPAELLTLVTFEDLKGKTKVTVRWYPINATEDEIKCFNEGEASMRQGWGGTLDRLETDIGNHAC